MMELMRMRGCDTVVAGKHFEYIGETDIEDGIGRYFVLRSQSLIVYSIPYYSSAMLSFLFSSLFAFYPLNCLRCVFVLHRIVSWHEKGELLLT